MKTIAYIRVSTCSQDFNSQRLAILDYAQKAGVAISEIIQFKTSTRSENSKLQLEQTIRSLSEGDQLIVSELSRLARSLGQIIKIVDDLTKQKIRFWALKKIFALMESKTFRPK